MSGFNENPFGAPTVGDPFADPAIQESISKPIKNVNSELENYNPFSGTEDNIPPPVVPNTAHYETYGQPAIMEPTQEHPPPAYSKNGQPPPISTTEFQRRQEELEKKAEELARREEELKNAPYNARRNNWPPLPESCCFQPCFYQDINIDIPSQFQKVVRLLYYLWMFHACVLMLNMLGGMAWMIQFQDVTLFGLSIFYAFIFTPISFLCWYRPAYKAFRNDSSFNFMVFFFIFFFQLVVSFIQTIGIPGSGTCGFLLAIRAFQGSTAGSIAVGVLVLIVALGFAATATMDLIMLSKIHNIYRHTDASIAKAQEEFTTEFLRNKHVQDAASDAAAAAIRAQVTSSPRY